jgi:glutathionylspermidine synthase
MEIFKTCIEEKHKDTSSLFDLNNKTEDLFIDFAQLKQYISKLHDYRYIFITQDQEQYIKNSSEELRKMLFYTCKYVLDPKNEELLKNFDVDPIFWERIATLYL